MATHKRDATALAVSTIPMLTDVPRGTGGSMITDYEVKMTRVCDEAGPIVSSVWHADTTMIDAMKPDVSLPAEWNFDMLKLANVGIKDVYQPAAKQKSLFRKWQTYAIMTAKCELASLKIYNAVIRTIKEDLLDLVEGNTELDKKNGPALFVFIKTQVLGGGATLRRVRIKMFYDVDFTGGDNVNAMFAKLAKKAR